MKKMIPWLAALSLSGCALPPGSCDPTDSDVSIIHKLQCDVSGGYRQTVDDKEANLVAAKKENELFRESLEALEQQRAALDKSVQEQRKARDAVVSSTRKLLDQLREKGNLSDRMKVQLSLAEKNLAELQKQPPKANASSAEIESRERKVQELEQMVKRLRSSVLQSS